MVATSEVSASIPSTLPGPWLPFCLPWHSLLPLLLSPADQKDGYRKNEGYMRRGGYRQQQSQTAY